MKRQRHWTTRVFSTLLLIIAVVFLLHTTCLTQISVGHSAFAPWLRAGDHLLVYRWAYGWTLPWGSTTHSVKQIGSGVAERGEWVWAHVPNDTNCVITQRKHTIGQVQAVAGDTLWINLEKRAVTPTRQENAYPLVVPTPEHRIRLTPWNIHIMAYTLRQHEGRQVTYINDSTLSVDGKAQHEVAFVQPYYWLAMPQAKAVRNANDTIDSYYYGFVPSSHLMGRVWLISYSVSDSVGVDWERMFLPLPQ